jgi:hypothetical protein
MNAAAAARRHPATSAADHQKSIPEGVKSRSHANEALMASRRDQ